MPVATQIQRLVVLYGKTWVLYFAYPDVGLSHCLAKDKQLDSPRRDILGWVQYTQSGRSCCVSSWLVNLRDSTSEDNVRKRPLTTKV